MSAKYYISFTSDLDKKCRIEFNIPGYEGDPIELDGSGCSILYDGDDILAPIITSKASLSVNYNEQFLADTRDADDKEIPVTIWHGDKKWIGFLIADNRDETFDKTNYPIQLTCVDPFSYIRGLQNGLFRSTDMFGRQSIESVIKGVFEPVLGAITIDVLNDLLPTDSISGNIINQCYCFTQVFQDESGLYINGYDIIEKIMTDLVMTAVYFNGVLVLRNNRYLESKIPVEVGLNEYDDFNFWIDNSELITRSRGSKETSRSISYPDMASLFANPRFYYYDDSNPSGEKVKGWFMQSMPWHDVTGIEYIGTGREKSPYGFRITGFGINPINEGKDVGPLWSTSIIDMPIDSALAPVNYTLSLKYRYGRYPIVLDDDGNQRKLTGAVNIIARDLGGSGKVMYYSNEGKTGIGNYSVSQWQENISGSGFNSLPRVYFPMDNVEEIQEVEISLPGLSNYGLTGPVEFEILLWNVGVWNNNDSIISAGGGASSYPDSIEYFNADVCITREGEAYYNGNAGIDRYASEQTFITNRKNYSLIKDTIDMTMGRVYYINFKEGKIDQFNRASLTYPSGEAISAFKQASAGYTEISLLDYGAKSDMYFNRNPRNIIEGSVRGDISIVDVFSSPRAIGGKYLCIKDEYDLYADTHNVTLHELKGSDDSNDIIENFLSTDQ